MVRVRIKKYRLVQCPIPYRMHFTTHIFRVCWFQTIFIQNAETFEWDEVTGFSWPIEWPVRDQPQCGTDSATCTKNGADIRDIAYHIEHRDCIPSGGPDTSVTTDRCHKIDQGCILFTVQ
ncbi:hypothetical protein RvY_02148-3 [Ramazzottius varieornatus]|uniref:Uncharacterized protein n=1 Tax=Ramazzottius varieornatus TaxID=947166 RepID=A0A1D1UIR9_RAMVA|nr:hypothetical protein RvY_02148-3 [Ramazzottius varieornatus]